LAVISIIAHNSTLAALPTHASTSFFPDEAPTATLPPAEDLPPRVATSNDLLEWIRATDLETFQRGRYQKGISPFVERGYMLIPSFENSNTVLREVVIMPDRHTRYDDTSSTIYHIYERNDEIIAISFVEANVNLINEVGGDIRPYATHYFADEMISGETFEIMMIINGVEELVTYVTVTHPRGTSKWAIFIVSNFEVSIFQDQNYWSHAHLQDLHFAMYDIATGLPVDGAPIATPPPNDNNGENGVDTQNTGHASLSFSLCVSLCL